jgi:hypothetical protein
MTFVYHADRPDYRGIYPLRPEEAVMTAYAHSLDDYDHWGFDSKYLQFVFISPSTGWVYCGPFMARVEETVKKHATC